MIGNLCYHPFMAAGSTSPAAIFRGIELFGGCTLVVDESDFYQRNEKHQEIMTILRQGFQRGAGVLRAEPSGDTWAPKAYDVFGPKVLAGRDRFPDAALESRCMRVYMQSGVPHGHLSVELPDADLYLETRGHSRTNSFSGDLTTSTGSCASTRLPVESRLLQLFNPLASVVEDPKALRVLEAAVVGLQREMTEGRRESLEGRVLNAMMELVEDRRPEDAPHRLQVKEIAERAAQGSRAPASKQVQRICRGFGLPDGGRTKDGATILFDPNRCVEHLRQYGLIEEGTLAAAA